MAERSIKHASFVIERSYDASPAEVFAAWADPAAKARWFSGPEEWEAEPHEVDFRVGGHEVSIGGPKGGPVHTSSCASRAPARYSTLLRSSRDVAARAGFPGGRLTPPERG
jgi:uncharacterized protein YndB with AHSA1/START domain